jgi:hypothetical protein
MEYVSKTFVMNNLNKEWMMFINELKLLKDDERGRYLEKQGYPNVCALLGHIIGWWNEAYINIGLIIANPEYLPTEYDVDIFNANIIENVKGKEEQKVVEEFESLRLKLIELIGTVDESQINNGTIQKELYWNITNHYSDHRIR